MISGPITHTCACDTVLITLSGGAYTSQSSRAGVYVKMEGTVVGGRHVYQSRDDGSEYLYFWAAYNDWRVGLDYRSEVAWIFAGTDGNSDLSCPGSVNTWRYWSGSEWATPNAGEMSIACSPLTARSPRLEFPNASPQRRRPIKNAPDHIFSGPQRQGHVTGQVSEGRRSARVMGQG